MLMNFRNPNLRIGLEPSILQIYDIPRTRPWPLFLEGLPSKTITFHKQRFAPLDSRFWPRVSLVTRGLKQKSSNLISRRAVFSLNLWTLSQGYDDMISWVYSPENSHSLWKVMVGRLLSFWNGPSSGDMLILGGVTIHTSDLLGTTGRSLSCTKLTR